MIILKKAINKFALKLGYKVLRIEKYKSFTNAKKIENRVAGNNSISLLSRFFNIIKTEGFEPTIIYDIGANKGYWTQECLRYFPHATYYLFEPQEGLKEHIELATKGYENVQLFSVGLGSANDEVYFTMHDRDDSCSFRFSEEEAKSRGLHQIKLPIFRLDSFVKEHGLKAPSILKIDAEGLDLEVIEGAGELLSEVEIIMVEVSIMTNRIENTALRVMQVLDSKGFKIFEITDMNRPFPNQVLWLCEFVFIKKEGILDKDYYMG